MAEDLLERCSRRLPEPGIPSPSGRGGFNGSDRQAAPAEPLLDNIEGMAITGRDKNRLKVLLVSDDNQNAAQTTRLYYLRVRV